MKRNSGPAARKPSNAIVTTNCLVVFTEMAGVMAKADIAKTAEKGRWTDVRPALKGMAKLSDEFRHHLL